jgi:hypothetical protein
MSLPAHIRPSDSTILKEVFVHEDKNFPGQFRVVLEIQIAPQRIIRGGLIGFKYVTVKEDLDRDAADRLAAQMTPMKGHCIAVESSIVITGQIPY